ncbi:MAG: tetratricopeptide repeat protein [Pseudomonadota bacterium]
MLVIALAVSALYWPFRWNPLVFDDNNFFGGKFHSEYLGTVFSFSRRWLPYASFEWTRELFGVKIIWFRIGNLALHIATAAVLFQFLRKLYDAVLPQAATPAVGPVPEQALSPVWLAFFGALIFALHPAAVYAVAYLIQRSTLMATLFTVIMWYLLLEGVTRGSRWRLILSACAYLLAGLSKEHAIMAPAVALAMLVLVRKPALVLLRQVALTFVLYVLIGAFILYQIKAQHVVAQAYEPRGADMLAAFKANDAAFDVRLAYPLSIVTQFFLFFKYWLVWILPSPAWMSIDMFEDFAVRFWSWPYTAGLIAFLLYPVLAVRLLLQRGERGLLGFALLCPWLMFATELSTVRIQESFVLYRSYLWMPGIFAALPLLFAKVAAKRTAIILIAFALVMVPASRARLLTFSAPVLAWNDAARLVKDKDDRPGVERIYHNRGLQMSYLGYFREALVDFDKALSLNPNHILSYNDRGATYLDLGDYPRALTDFNKTLELNPQFPRAYFGRALTYQALNRHDEARQNYRQLCALGYSEGCEKFRNYPNNKEHQSGNDAAAPTKPATQ